jgi:hypothetical protein
LSNSNSPSAASSNANDDGSQPIEWVHMTDYTSRDVNNPDLLEIKVLSTETFETKHSTAVTIGLKKGIDYVRRHFSLKRADARYGKPYKIWVENVAIGKIRPGSVFIMKTWLRESETTPGRTVRDYEALFKKEEAGGQQQSTSSSSSLTEAIRQ